MKKHFITNDIGLATMLSFVGSLEKVINDKFFFTNDEEIESMVKEYGKRKLTVEPHIFLEKYWYLQKLVYSNIK